MMVRIVLPFPNSLPIYECAPQWDTGVAWLPPRAVTEPQSFCSRSDRSVNLDCLHSLAMERAKELQSLYIQCSALPTMCKSAQLAYGKPAL